MVIIICNDKHQVIIDENAITGRIKEVLGDKGGIFWCKGYSFPQEQSSKRPSRLRRSESLPEGAARRSVELRAQRKNVEVSTLVLKTRLRYGEISYQDKDVEMISEGWAPPQEIVDNLLKQWRSTSDAELLIYRDNETGNDRVVVKEDSKITQLTETLKDVKDTFQNKAKSGCFAFIGKKDASDDEISPD